jgi:hypothetical protein
MKGQTLLEGMIIFFIVFFVIWGLASWIFNNSQIGFILGLFAGFIISGGGKFIWTHRS